MNLSVNILAIILSTIAALAIGAVWYSPKAFLVPWSRLLGKSITPAGGPPPLKPIIISAVAAFATAYAIAVISINAYTAQIGNLHTTALTPFWQVTLWTGFLTWLAFAVARFATHNAFEGRPWLLIALNLGHELVVFMTMAAIIGFLHA